LLTGFIFISGVLGGIRFHGSKGISDQEEFLGGKREFRISDFRYQISDIRYQISDFRFQISHLTFKLICINTSHFYATTLINHKQVWTQWKFDVTLFWLDYLIRINLFDAVKTKKIYSEVEQLVRLFNAIKSTMKINIGGKKK